MARLDLDIKCNVGTQERVFRLLGGVLASSAALRSDNPSIKFLLGAIGLEILGSGITRYSPAYHLLGINRCQPAYRSVRQLLRRI
jgi:hypothetical protein